MHLEHRINHSIPRIWIWFADFRCTLEKGCIYRESVAIYFLDILAFVHHFCKGTENISMRARFIIYGLVGWIAETIFTGLGSLLSGDLTMRSSTSIWMFPIYGLMVLMEPLHDYMRKWPVVLRGGVYTIIIFGIEYTTGWSIRALIGKSPWDYGIERYSIDGLITLRFIPVWFIGGLLFEKLHDLLNKRRIVKE